MNFISKVLSIGIGKQQKKAKSQQIPIVFQAFQRNKKLQFSQPNIPVGNGIAMIL